MREPILEFGPRDWLRLRASTMMSSYLALTRVVMLIEIMLTRLMVMMSNSDVDQGDVKEDVQHKLPLPVCPHGRLPGPRCLPRWPSSPARCCRSACRGIINTSFWGRTIIIDVGNCHQNCCPHRVSLPGLARTGATGGGSSSSRGGGGTSSGGVAALSC